VSLGLHVTRWAGGMILSTLGKWACHKVAESGLIDMFSHLGLINRRILKALGLFQKENL
jgi:hypothetical protein